MDEPDGFADFVRARSRPLLRAAWLLTGDWNHAEDLVQTALARAWPRWDGIAEPARAAYVNRVMVRTFLAWRKRLWNKEFPTHAASLDRPTVADDFSGVEQRLVVRNAMLSLPHRQRAVIVLRYFADLSEADTAHALGCSIGTVKSHSSRALRTLRAIPGLSAESSTEGITS